MDKSAWRNLKLRYTTPELLFHRIEIDSTCAVLVIGGDGEGAYEWVIEKDGKVDSHSDAGYGMPFVALRDGLTSYWPPADKSAASETQAHPDTARLDHLAEITNLATLLECGAMLPGDKMRKIDKTTKALSSGYEVHRRTHDTPEAFRLAVDDAIKECK